MPGFGATPQKRWVKDGGLLELIHEIYAERRARAAVDAQHRGQFIGLAADGKGEVALDLKAVPGGEGERLHSRQPVGGERRLVTEEEGRRTRLAVPGVVGGRAVVDGKGHEPRTVGVIPSRDGEVTSLDGSNPLRRPSASRSER